MKPFFLETGHGRLFAIHYPEANDSRDTLLVHCPAFAEEMNKSRRMVALQAGELARAGIGALVADPYGTGDSEGHFHDATWERWTNDVQAAVEWARREGYGRVLGWGLRGGCLLAAALSERNPGLMDGYLFWNPVTSGKTWLSQFLRLRTVAKAFAGGDKETVKELMRRLEAGEPVEVAGYGLNPELALPLAASRLDAPDSLADCNVVWLEISSRGDGELAPASQAIVERMRERGTRLTTTVIEGDNFWSTQEIATAPELIGETVNQVRQLLTR